MDIDLATVTIFFVGTALGALLAWVFISRLKDSEITEARIENATLKAKGSSFENQITELQSAREALVAQFQVTSNEILEKAQESFLKRADERFKQSEQSSEEKIKALLNPVGEKLKNYEEQVTSLEKMRVDSFGELKGLINSMREGQEAVRREAQRLGNSLTNASAPFFVFWISL